MLIEQAVPPLTSPANESMTNAAMSGTTVLMGGMFLFLVIFVIFISIVSILLTILWIFMIIDCAKRKFEHENDKVIWILVIVLASYIGAIVYYFVIKVKDKKQEAQVIAPAPAQNKSQIKKSKK